MYLNIELIPPDPLYTQLIRLNHIARSQYHSSYNPNGVFCPPHITLYSPCMPASNVPKALDAVGKIAKDTPPITVRLRDIDFFPDGTVYVRCRESREIFQLHSKIVEKLDQLREGHIDPDYKENQQMLQLSEKRLLEKYGDPHVMENFQPHIAVARVSTSREHIDDLIKLLAGNLLVPNFAASFISIRGWEGSGESGVLLARYKMGI